MAKIRKEVSCLDLSVGRRWFIMILAGAGSGIIYTPLYLKSAFYDPLMAALNCTNTDLGALVGLYSIIAVILYIPCGIIADRVRQRTLYVAGMFGTAAVTLWYSFLPSLFWIYVIFVAMAITTIFIWWGCRLKLVRLAFPEDQYSTKVGISYTMYGIAGLVVGLINTAIVAAFPDDPHMAIRLVLWFLAALIFVLGLLGLIFIPDFKDEIDAKNRSSFKTIFNGLIECCKNPGLLWACIAFLFIYAVYAGLNYTTPFMTGVYATPIAVASVVSLIRNYGIGLISGPVAGWLAKAMHSPAKALMVISGVSIAVMIIFMILPRDPKIVVLVAILVVVAAFFAYGGYSIGTSTATEVKVPLRIFGMAGCMYSLIGFLPDVFIHAWFGNILDRQGDAGYNTMFIILAISGLIAIFCLMQVRRYVKKHINDPAPAGEENREEPAA